MLERFRPVATTLLFLCLGVPAMAGDKGQAAFLKSLVIPGWGQYELNRPRHAMAFLGADLLLIGSALSLNHHGQQLRDNYEAFAESNGGVTGSHGKEFYIDVANWMSVFDYNEQRMAERNFSALYDTETQYWMWSSEAERARMDDMRLDSDRSLNRVIYAVALVGVNHLVSAFHAGRLAAQTDRVEPRLGWNVSPEQYRDGGGVHFSLWW
ncbi:MAG: hypothetical protein IPG71_11750 [bacterium]|nr:hypothetical protein [bacterium]